MTSIVNAKTPLSLELAEDVWILGSNTCDLQDSHPQHELPAQLQMVGQSVDAEVEQFCDGLVGQRRVRTLQSADRTPGVPRGGLPLDNATLVTCHVGGGRGAFAQFLGKKYKVDLGKWNLKTVSG